MGFRTQTLRKIFSILFVLMLIITSVLLVVYYKQIKQIEEDLGPIKPLVEYIKEEEDDGYDLLLLGYGGAGHSGGGLSDAIIVAHVDEEQYKIYMIHVPRDLWVEIPIRSDDAEFFKINMAFAIGNDDNGYPYKETQYHGENGGGELAKHVVGEALGLRIDNYAAVDFGSYVRAIDALGGITVDVPVSFTEDYYPIKGKEDDLCGKTEADVFELKNIYGHSGFELEKQFECRYEQLKFTQGETKMDGDTALKFVRSRHSADHGGDFARGERQIAVLKGIRDKILSLGAIENYNDFYKEYKQMVASDIDLGLLRSLLNEMGDAVNYKIEHVVIDENNVVNNAKSADGQYILRPKSENALPEYVDQMVGRNE